MFEKKNFKKINWQVRRSTGIGTVLLQPFQVGASSGHDIYLWLAQAASASAPDNLT
jgi:hypothetical protein